jgi:hypothetical protein
LVARVTASFGEFIAPNQRAKRIRSYYGHPGPADLELHEAEAKAVFQRVKDELSDPLPPLKKQKETDENASSPATQLRLSLKTREALGLSALLGVVESVVAPTNIALSVLWYKKSEQPLIIAGYQAMLCLSSILAGLYGYGESCFLDNLRGFD